MPVTGYGVGISDSGREVVGWTQDARLPFESKPGTPARAFRDGLREHLAGLAAGPGEVLHATLTSPVRKGETVDAENVLLYNLASAAALAPSCRQGLQFEHLRASSGGAGDHEHRYGTATGGAAFEHYVETKTLWRTRWMKVPSWSEDKPALSRLWWPIRHSEEVEEINLTGGAPDLFAVRLELAAPARNAAPLTKKIVDAVVAATQYQALAPDPSVLDVLAAQTGESREVIGGVLTAGERAVLGQGSLPCAPPGRLSAVEPQRPWARRLRVPDL